MFDILYILIDIDTSTYCIELVVYAKVLFWAIVWEIGSSSSSTQTLKSENEQAIGLIWANLKEGKYKRGCKLDWVQSRYILHLASAQHK